MADFTVAELLRRRHRLVCHVDYLADKMRRAGRTPQNSRFSFTFAMISSLETALVLFDRAIAGADVVVSAPVRRVTFADPVFAEREVSHVG